jgi:hypothetical protein
MAYATTSHVEAMLLGRLPLGTQGQVSATQVVNWLEQTAGVIDGLLAQNGYSAPVSPTAASSALKTLEGFNTAGAWYHVEAASKTRDKVKFEEAKRMWGSAQKMLSDGIVELDLEIDTAEALPRGGFSCATPPFFSRDMEL